MVVVGNPQAKVLSFFLGRLAGHLTQIAVHFDCDMGHAGFVSSRVFLDYVGQEPIQNQKAMANEVIVSLLSYSSIQLRLPHGFRDEQAPAFFLGMFASHDLLPGFHQEWTCIGGAAFQAERLGREMVVQEFVAGKGLVLLACLGVGGIELFLDQGIERVRSSRGHEALNLWCGGWNLLTSAATQFGKLFANLGQREGRAAPPLATQSFLKSFRQQKPERLKLV